LTRSRRHLGSALSAALVAVLVIAAGPRRAVGATDTRVRLEYQADEQGGCVGADDLRRMVTDQLGHDPFRSDADQQVAISIAKTEIGFQGRIVWTEVDGRQVGERLLSSRSRDCREIAANVAFAVALQLQLVERGSSDDAGAGAATVDGSTPQTTGPPDRVAVTPERPSVSTEAPAVPGEESSSPVRLAVGAGPAVAMGMTPDVTAFGRLFVVARLRRLSGEIAADAALPTTLDYRDGTGVVVNALGSSAAGCAHAEIVSACLLGRIGWLRAQGTGIAVPRTSWGRFGEVGMRLAATKELGQFTVSVHADGLVMLSHWNVVLNDAVVWDVPRVGIVVGLDVALRFF
jgi:hypothetical protein